MCNATKPFFEQRQQPVSANTATPLKDSLEPAAGKPERQTKRSGKPANLHGVCKAGTAKASRLVESPNDPSEAAKLEALGDGDVVDTRRRQPTAAEAPNTLALCSAIDPPGSAVAVWRTAVSRSTGREYYYNPLTGERTYAKPAEGVRQETAAAAPVAVVAVSQSLSKQYQVAQSEQTKVNDLDGKLNREVITQVFDAVVPELDISANPQTPFMDLGLDSLEMKAIADALTKALGTVVSTLVLFEHVCLQSLIGHFAKTVDPAAALMVHKAPKTEFITIVGTDCCRALGAGRMFESFCQAHDPVTAIPFSRFDTNVLEEHGLYVNHGHFLPEIEMFDNEYFSIGSQQTGLLDPHQRLLLESATNAISRSGHTQPELLGQKIGVFIGFSTATDWANRRTREGPENHQSPYANLGIDPAAAAGRISFLNGLTGPALTCSTACSSALVATHLAMLSLNNDDCHTAVVGTTNLQLDYTMWLGFCSAKALSPDGLSKSFDSAANGYGRGEGVGTVILTTGDSIAFEDIMAESSAINQDGKSVSFMAPSGTAQHAVIKDALWRSSVKTVTHIESHGTGTGLGDPIEHSALMAALQGKNIVIAALKSVLGHTQGASGLCALAKAIVQSHKRTN